jgi:hypothetical protein
MTPPSQSAKIGQEARKERSAAMAAEIEMLRAPAGKVIKPPRSWLMCTWAGATGDLEALLEDMIVVEEDETLGPEIDGEQEKLLSGRPGLVSTRELDSLLVPRDDSILSQVEALEVGNPGEFISDFARAFNSPIQKCQGCLAYKDQISHQDAVVQANRSICVLSARPRTFCTRSRSVS